MDAEKFSIRKFARALDVADTNIRNYIDKGTKPSSDVVEKILRVFPRTNPAWLIMGEGEPFLPDSGETSEPRAVYQKNNSGFAIGVLNGTSHQHQYTVADCEKERDGYRVERDAYKSELDASRREIGLLTSQLADKERMIQLLLKQTS